MTEFDGLSRAYDALSYDLETKEWTRYLLSLLPEGPLRILEYGCGTGRITEGLLAAGHFVIGLDRSEGMLQQAMDRLRPHGRRFELVEADMRTFRLEKPVDAVVCACDGINYLLTEEDLRSCFACAHRNLKDGGPFLFDISSNDKIERVLGNEFFFDDGEEETLLWLNSYDPDRHLVQMNLSFFIRRSDGLYERMDEVHRQRAWHAGEIVHFLAKTGYSNVKVFDFGTGDAPTPESGRIQFVAKKGKIK